MSEEILRVEVVANRSVQEDFFELLTRAGLAGHYTLFPEVQGAGDAGPRRGDHIWPEENFLFIAYVSRAEAVMIRDLIRDLQERFSSEGIRIFATPTAEL